jgi:hypothetical protein
MGRRLLAAAIAGLICGVVVLGLGGRVMMRVVAIAGHRPVHFGAGATAGILLIGGVLGLIGGLGFGLLQRALPGSAAVKGLLYGTLFFVVVVPLQPAPIQAEITDLRAIWSIVIPLFWALFLAFGVGVARWGSRPAAPGALAA